MNNYALLKDKPAPLGLGRDNVLYMKVTFNFVMPVQWVPGVLPGIKWLGHDADHSSPSCTKVKNESSYISSPPKCLHGVKRGSCIFTVPNTLENKQFILAYHH
jgi:hypothetical protein